MYHVHELTERMKKGFDDFLTVHLSIEFFKLTT